MAQDEPPSNGSEHALLSRKHAQDLDAQDPLKHFRNEFIIPSKSDLKSKTLKIDKSDSQHDDTPSVYLCGNSLGLQPKRTSTYIQNYLSTWSTKGVYGHFKQLSDSPFASWVNMDDQAAEAMAPIVGAKPSEVAIMQTLTANLHFLMASFYRPTSQRWKIVIEGKAFPSDHYAVHSQLHHHNLDPATSLILIEPDHADTNYMSTQHIKSVIEQNANEVALILLPGIQFYSGQLLDIKGITEFAHSKGITIGWDLAHAAGNVPLHLHDWSVDFAAWCSYKYLNSGAGCIAALFVHEKHGRVADSPPRGWGSGGADGSQAGSVEDKLGYKPRLSGWWGSRRESRFRMENVFEPIAGAAGWQMSNPSALDTTSLLASLAVFAETGMPQLRRKSLQLTSYLETLLLTWPAESMGAAGKKRRPYTLLTPRNPEERGAQISVRLDPGLLEGVMRVLELEGVVVDERRPDVVRVAPAPLYNSFEDVWLFMDIFSKALAETAKTVGDAAPDGGRGTMVELPNRENGWSEIT